MRKPLSCMSGLLSPEGRSLPVIVIIAAILFLTGRYLLYGVPHEFITGEYKATFEGDYDFTLELVKSFREWRSVPLWSETYSGPIAVFASNFHVFEQALLYPLTESLPLSIKVLQTLQFLVAGLGMYLLANYVYGDRRAASLSAILYMFTPFYIGHLLSYLHYTGVYLLAPTVFYLILRTVREQSYRNALLLSVVSAYSLLAHPQNIFIGGIFYALFFVLVAADGLIEALGEGEMRLYLKRIAAISAVTASTTFLLSAFITLPTLLDGYPYIRTSWVKGAGDLVKVDHGHIGSHSQTLLSALTLQHWPWLQTPLKGGEYPFWGPMAAYLIPFVMTAVALLATRITSLTAILLSLLLVSVHISLGVKGIPDLFTFAAKHLPFFGMSRTPYAYINAAILVMCLLPAAAFVWISERLRSFQAAVATDKGSSLASWALFVMIAVPYLLAARHYGNSYNWTFISARQPEYLDRVWGWMEENNKARYRVIETCGIPTAMILGERMLPNQVDLLERFHKKGYLAEYLSLLGFGHVITPALPSQRDKTFDVKGYTVPSVFDSRDSLEEYYSALTTDYYYMYQRLSSDPDFALHTAGTRDVAIFTNRLAFPGYEMYPGRAVMVLGGTDGYDILGLSGFGATDGNGRRLAPVFIAQEANLNRLKDISEVSDALVLHNTDALDLFLLLNRGSITMGRPDPVDATNWSLAIHSYGIQQPFPYQDHSIGNSLSGEMTFSDFAVTSSITGSSLRKEFTVDKDGLYVILLRSYGGADMSPISVSLDGRKSEILWQDGHSGFRWLTAWEGELRKGPHRVEFALEEDRPVYIDSVAVAEKHLVEEGADNAFGVLEGVPLTYIINHRKFVPGGDSAVTEANIADGVYTPSIRIARVGRPDAKGPVRLTIDGIPAGEVGYDMIGEETKEFMLPEIVVSGGLHEITLSGLTEGMYFDLLSLTSVRKGGNKDHPAPALDFVKTGPSSYRFSLKSGRPELIVFNETNYEGWKMSSGGVVERPIVTNMFMNGFIVRPDGDGRVKDAIGEVYYSNTAQKAGIALSAVALLFTAVVISGGLLRRRR